MITPSPSQIPTGEWVSEEPKETFNLGKLLGKQLAGGEILLLSGPLGAGKTIFVKGIAAALGVDPDEVTSPSFTLVNPYAGRLSLFHIDLYRLNNLNEALDVGIEEYLASGNYCFIEWAELIKNLLPEETVIVKMSVGTNNERLVSVETNFGNQIS